ncbi:class II aldolase/adducin family protein [candidate division KSB1 bacterium]|nr:class II aldolase/adducin family protein [candidate division KSB1 bacterium]
MQLEYIHPKEQLSLLMKRIYRYGMTTTSGGNMSIHDESGDIWITPAGVDKGSLDWDHMVRIKNDGSIKGQSKPSSEYPFHKAIYAARPDLRGIVHAHPSALVSFSIVRKKPPVKIIPQASDICGRIGYAPYALPGSDALGKNIADAFRQGYDAIIMENHGVVCGGKSLLDAFHRFETLDFCARLAIKATMLGEYNELTDDQLALFNNTKNYLIEFDPLNRSNREKAYRHHIREIVHRAYEQQLMTSTEGVISVRVDRDTFLITPTNKDRRLIDVQDIVLISERKRERGKLPSRAVLVHDRIYRDHPHIQAIVSAQAPNATAFSISQTLFDTRSIPESYILLRDIAKVPYGPQFNDEGRISRAISKEIPVVLLENDAILATGESLLQAYDRLEVAEFSARSLIDARLLGGLAAISDKDIEKIKRHFLDTK